MRKANVGDCVTVRAEVVSVIETIDGLQYRCRVLRDYLNPDKYTILDHAGFTISNNDIAVNETECNKEGELSR